LIDQLLIKGEEVKLYLELIPERLFTKRTESSRLQEINPPFDTQNMPKNANDKVFTGLIQQIENFVL
jgi:hypothetical protein